MGVALGKLGVALGRQGVAVGPQGFTNMNMLVSPTRKSRIGGLDQCKAPMQVVSHCSVI